MSSVDTLVAKQRQDFAIFLKTKIDLNDHAELAKIVSHASSLAGGQSSLAEALGVNQSTVSRWIEGGTQKLRRYEKMGIIAVLRELF